jgi:hypothetical protein
MTKKTVLSSELYMKFLFDLSGSYAIFKTELVKSLKTTMKL